MGGWKYTVELEAPEEANRAFRLQRLAELQQDKDEWKTKASDVLKDMLGMVAEKDEGLPQRAVQGFVQAFDRLATAKEANTDPTI